MRTFAELTDYAVRLHESDPYCTEPVPVTPDEAVMVQDVAARDRAVRCGLVAPNARVPHSLFDMQLAGHKLKVL